MEERFGGFVLLGELQASWRGTEYLAAALAGSEVDRLVSLLRIARPLGQGDVLLDHLRASAALRAPHIVGVREVGRVDGEAFVASDLVEGRTLQAVLARSREEVFPFSVENALQVAERVAGALEVAHGHRGPGGEVLLHGLMGPHDVVLAYDGEVSVRGFGWWTSRAWEGHLPEDERSRLPPEQRAGAAEPRSDVFGVGALLLECLTGMGPGASLAGATLLAGGPLPPAIAELLEKALSSDPAGRHASIAELRQALDHLLFAGEFSPTTFNLAYFMHTLFRDVVEQDAQRLEGARRTRPAGPVSPEPTKATPPAPVPSVPRSTVPSPARTGGGSPRAARISPRSPAAPPPRRGGVRRAALAGVLVLGAGAAYLLFAGRGVPAPPPEPPLPPEAVAALARVRELEARLKAIEEENARAQATAAEQAKQRLEAEAAAKGRAVDREQMLRAQEEAMRKARAEQERRQEVERKRLEDEKRAEERRVAAARAVSSPSAPPVTSPAPLPAPAATPSPSPSPPSVPSAPPPSSLPAVSRAPAGTPPVYASGEAGLVAPVLETSPPLEYPLLARASRLEGVVVVSAVVDESGKVIEASAISPGNEILRRAAEAHARSRRYRPGTKDGVPVRIRMVIRVLFRYPK